MGLLPLEESQMKWIILLHNKAFKRLNTFRLMHHDELRALIIVAQS